MSKIIRGGNIDDYQAWQPPLVGDGAHASHGISVLTAKQIEQVQQAAHDEGFAAGYAEGLASVRAPLEAVLAALAEPLAELDESVMQELVSLITAVTRQLVRRELKTEPGEIVAVVREALSALPSAARKVRVHLHPEDAALVRAALSLNDTEAEEQGPVWRVLDEPVQARGGCRVVSDTSQIDASVEARLAAVVARMLGGERESDEARG